MSSLHDYNDTASRFSESYSGSDKSTDLRNHLLKQHSDISAKDLTTVLNSFIAESDPPQNSIPKKGDIGDGWYTFDTTNDHNFRIYFQDVLDLPDPASEQSIAASSLQLVNRLPNPKDPDFKPVSGLVIGNVQSGKTANYTALIARAADSGYNLVIVLSGGNFNDLRVQTQKRLFNDLVDPVNSHPDSKKWHKSTNIQQPKNKGDIGDAVWNPDWDIGNENCLLVSKKNSETLPRITAWLKNYVLPTAEALGTKINLLLLDDEADHASLNLELTKKRPDNKASRINREVRTLLHQVERKAYVGFTASPFANMFVPPKYDPLTDKNGKHVPTLYPRDFIHLLPEPKGYFGLKKLCPGDEPKWTNHLSEVVEKEADFYRRNTEKKGLKESMKPGMEKSIFEFFTSLGIRIIRNDGDSNFHHSMLIHTKETKATMHGILETVRPYVTRLRGAIQSKKQIEKGRGRDSDIETYSKYKQYYNNVTAHSIDNPPSFDELTENLKTYFSSMECSEFPEVLEISSDEDKGDDLVYPKNEPYAVIAIGGNRLARGFTLEGLFTSYFVRSPKTLKSDTLLQQGRWFGFRGKDEDLVRIFTTESLRDEFWVLKRIENDLHDTIRHFEICNLDTEHYAVPIMKAKNQLPTSKDKLPKNLKKIVNSTFPGDYIPKRGSGFPIDVGTLRQTEHEIKNQKNHQAVGEFLDKLYGKSGTPERKSDGYYQIDDVPLAKIVSLFETSLDNFIDDPYNKKQLIQYLQTRATQGSECSKWTVAVMGNQPSSRDQKIKFGTSNHEFTLNLVQRTRIAKGVNDFGVFLPQTPHFAIGIESPEGSTIKQHCAERNRENPILLIYLIDKDSEPLKDENSIRARLGTKENIVVFAIGLPLATLTSDEKKNFNVESWHNQHLKLEEVA